MSTTLTLKLPRPHPGQREIHRGLRRFNAVACGRRFGKTVMGLDRLTRPALAGFPAAWFAPTYRYLTEVWRDFVRVLGPVLRKVNVQERRLELVTGGSIEFWSLEDPDAGRSRRYKRVVIDEAAKARNLRQAWQGAIRPTLTDFRGEADLYSTPRGHDFFWECYTKGVDPLEAEWSAWQMPTARNPFIDAGEIEAARRGLPERVFAQEYLAEFLEDAGGVFRKVREAVDADRTAPTAPVPGDSYVLGVDLARVEDFTVLCVLDAAGRQVSFERFNQVSWHRQIEQIRATAARYPGAVVVDSTGVGDPIVEALNDAGLTVVPYHFSNQTKNAAVDRLALLLEQGRIRLMDVDAQTAELLAYEYQLTPSRLVRTAAPEGMHDDCVMALALAAWGLERYAYQAPAEADLVEQRRRARAEADAARAAFVDVDNEHWWGN